MQAAGSALTNSASPSDTENLSDQMSNLNATSGSNGPTATTPDPTTSDLDQHCLLFPTYATRHSRSGSKDPEDWNIRVRGWAFSKRSNRRKRLVMSMARKIAGVTKDDKIYETLESRFGMFLASNTQGAQFMIQCVGLASTTHMELAGGSHSITDPTVDVLIDELESSAGEGAMTETEATTTTEQEHDHDQQSPEQDQGGSQRLSATTGGHGPIPPPLQHAAITALKSQLSEQVQRSVQEERRKQLEDAAQLCDVHTSSTSTTNRLDASLEENAQIDTLESSLGNQQDAHFEEEQSSTLVAGSVETESKFSARLSRGTALFKNVVRKVKTSTTVYSSSNGASTDSLKLPSAQQCSFGIRTTSSNMSDSSSADESPRPIAISRAASGASVLTQDLTKHEDLGHGVFPTVPVASRPGGHFDGTLRMSSSEVEVHRRKDTDAGHPRFLKLHAHHDDMPDPCHGVVNLIDPEGVSIISDIDDTIKETNVTAGARIILRNTFLKDMMEVEGMASVYKGWWNQGAVIHYVSNSPWQLIPSLLEFFQTHMFPPGSAHLRLQDNVLKTYFTTPGEHKRRSIREILTDFPDRKFILVGDSGEIDMEIYTEMALEFPGQIVKIFIRDITTARLKEMVSKMPPSRSLSFSSLLMPKTPLGFFSRRGSNANTIGSVTSNPNASSTNVATMSSTDDDYDNDDNEDDDDNDLDGNNHDETFDSGISGGLNDIRLDRPRYPHFGGSMSPKLDPSGPFTPPAMSLSTTPTSSTASSPRLQPKQITATVKAVFGSTFRRASPNNNNTNKQAAMSGWSALRKRTGSMSPASPLSEGVTPITGYPFPKVGSATSSSVSSLSGQQKSRRNGDAQDEEDYGQHSTLSLNSYTSSNLAQNADKITHGANDIFDDQDHQHVMLQQQQQQQQRRPRQRTNTFSFMPFANSPPRSPKIPIRGERIIGFSPRPEPHPLETALSAKNGSSSTAMSPSSTSPVDGQQNVDSGKGEGRHAERVEEPHSTSPSLSQSSPSSPVATPSSFSSNSKNPLEVWLERIQQCRRRLPKGMLTLFESAEELEQCEIVQEVFRKYGGSSTHDQDHRRSQHEHIGGISFESRSAFSAEASMNTGTTRTTTSSSSSPSSLRSCRNSISTLTTTIASVSVSSRTTGDYTSTTNSVEMTMSQSHHHRYTESGVDRVVLKSVVAN
ncbi:hypothetical protein BGX23_012128 [Mortierella sp. AD031]|nr:hypothetical protein BGX23_012128 [Mortierella sp. AD031]